MPKISVSEPPTSNRRRPRKTSWGPATRWPATSSVGNGTTEPISANAPIRWRKSSQSSRLTAEKSTANRGRGRLEQGIVEEGDDAPLVCSRLLVDAVRMAALGLPDLLRLLRRPVVVGIAVARVVLAAVDEEDRPRGDLRDQPGEVFRWQPVLEDRVRKVPRAVGQGGPNLVEAGDVVQLLRQRSGAGP